MLIRTYIPNLKTAPLNVILKLGYSTMNELVQLVQYSPKYKYGYSELLGYRGIGLLNTSIISEAIDRYVAGKQKGNT